jgi:Spy/CpxP family protein refolding chaperone
MAHKFIRGIALAALAGGMLLAQTQGTQPGRQHGAGRRLDRMSTVLGLNDAQKTQAKSIFDAEHQAAKPLFQQMRTLHQSLRSAVTTGNGNIDQLSGQLGTLTGQVAGIHAKSMAQFYAMLTPDQQAKAQAMGPLGGRFRGGSRN